MMDMNVQYIVQWTVDLKAWTVQEVMMVMAACIQIFASLQKVQHSTFSQTWILKELSHSNFDF